MSHFSVLVLVDPTNGADVKAEVVRLLAPYYEDGEHDEGPRWDWWQIGGRWTGSLDGYDPDKDARNYRPCKYCNGTGTRTDVKDQDELAWSLKHLPEYWLYREQKGKGCNACYGTGMELLWPTLWLSHPGDIMPVKNVRSEFVPHAVLTPDGKWHERDDMYEHDNEKGYAEWKAGVKELLAPYQEFIAVVVDCHV